MSSRVAFIAGATGYTGRALVRVLCQRGDQVIAHVRPRSSARERLTAEFEALGARVDASEWDSDAMEAALAACGPTEVYALLGTTRKRASKDGQSAQEAYEAIDYGLTSLLLHALERSGRPARFVYLSAAGLSPDTKNPYMKARVRIEAELVQSALDWTVVRPSFISGDREESRPGESVAAVLGDGALAVAGFFGAKMLRDRYQSLTAAELAAGLARVAVADDSLKRVVHADELR